MHIDDLTSSDGRMDDRAGPAADDGAVRALTWDALEERLAAVLRRMAVDTFLILSTSGADDSAYYVQFAQGGRPGFRAEAVSNSFLAGARALSPAQEELLGRLGWQWPSGGDAGDRNFSRQWPQRAPFRDVARLAVRTLRDVYGIRGPDDLVYRRFDDTGRDFPVPELGIRAEALRPPRGATLGRETDADGLDAVVERAVKSFLCVDHLVRDGDGDIPIHAGGAYLFVRVLGGPSPAVRVFSPVLRAVGPTYDLLSAVNHVNTRLLYARALWVAGDVIIAAEVPGAQATEALVGSTCAEVAGLAESIGAELGDRFAPAAAPRERPPQVN
jgi:hypothetical protein